MDLREACTLAKGDGKIPRTIPTVEPCTPQTEDFLKLATRET